MLLVLFALAVLEGCISASPGVARDVPQYRAAYSLTPFGLGEISVAGRGTGADRRALESGLTRVLRTSNYFDSAAAGGAARVNAKILRYSQPPVGTGFTTTLTVQYEVLAPNGTAMYTGELTTQGVDDSGATIAAQRAGRAKTLAMANNLFDFRTDLEVALTAYTTREHPAYLVAAQGGRAAPVGPVSGGLDADQLGEAIVPLDLAEFDKGANLQDGTYYALVIGNNRYAKLPSLETAANDARAVARLLEKSYGYEVTTLIDAGRSEILGSLTNLRRRLTENDSVLIYYAGHGSFDRGTRRGYWLPVDALEDDPSNWISAADVTDILRAMAARHVMIVADSCYSGSLTRGLKIETRDQAYIKRLASKRARVVLTSGGLEPVTDMGTDGHSVFARAFLDALEGNQGVLEGVGVFNQLRRPVVMGADQTPEYGDIRFAGHEGGDFLFIRQ